MVFTTNQSRQGFQLRAFIASVVKPANPCHCGDSRINTDAIFRTFRHVELVKSNRAVPIYQTKAKITETEKSMRINPNSDHPADGVQPTRNTKPAAASKQGIDLAQSAELSRTLDTLPVVRPEKIAAARELLSDPSYPNDADLAKVADVLARNIRTQE
jgi:hypothetical protein